MVRAAKIKADLKISETFQTKNKIPLPTKQGPLVPKVLIPKQPKQAKRSKSNKGKVREIGMYLFLIIGLNKGALD